MPVEPKLPLLLFAEDDDEDWMLIEDAFDECSLETRLERVKDGNELLERLKDESKETPALVLLDLKMPMKNGHEALAEIRADQRLKHIPVVIMTASRSEADIYRSYYHGANSYIAKPVSEKNLKTMRRYWSDVVSLPKAV
jgi:two-component system response regulator